MKSGDFQAGRLLTLVRPDTMAGASILGLPGRFPRYSASRKRYRNRGDFSQEFENLLHGAVEFLAGDPEGLAAVWLRDQNGQSVLTRYYQSRRDLESDLPELRQILALIDTEAPGPAELTEAELEALPF